MNKRTKLLTQISLLVLFLNITTSFIGSNSYFENLINNLFLTSLICLMLGGTLLVLAKGVLNNFFNSIKRFSKSISYVDEYVSEQVKDNDNNLLIFPDFKITYHLLILGGLLFCFTFIISLLMS